MPNYNLGPSVASDDETAVRSNTEEMTPTTDRVQDGIDISQWIAAQSEAQVFEDATPAESSQKPSQEVKLQLSLPCGQHEAFGMDEIVIRSPQNNRLHMRDTISSNNPSRLEAFINEHFEDVSKVAVTFCLAKLADDAEIRIQLRQCLEALIRLADQCSFFIKCEYVTTLKGQDNLFQGNSLELLRDTIVGRFKMLAEKAGIQELTVKAE